MSKGLIHQLHARLENIPQTARAAQDVITEAQLKVQSRHGAPSPALTFTFVQALSSAAPGNQDEVCKTCLGWELTATQQQQFLC